MLSQPDPLRCSGLVPFTTVDYPGRLAAVIFCQGCTWRCRYCHNTHLQPFGDGALDWREVDAFLESRTGLLEAVVFSGGEPTAQAALEPAMRRVRELGFLVGLHTAGIFPERLRRILPLADWVGLDVKAPFDHRYDSVTQVKNSWEPAARALDAVLEAGIPYELRTTVHPALMDLSDQEELTKLLIARGAQLPRWQKFRPQGCADFELAQQTSKT